MIAGRDGGDVYLAAGELKDGPHRSRPITPGQTRRALTGPVPRSRRVGTP
jgi:hypothetical protein